MQDDHSTIVDTVYEAAVLPQLWPSALTQVGGPIDAWGGAVVTIDHQHQTRFMTTEGYARTYEEFGRSGMAYENRRTTRHLARRHAGFLSDIETCTVDELEIDPIYTNFLYPYGIGWTVGTLIPVPTSEMLVFDFCSLRDRGPFGPEAVNYLDTLRPHLARAALLSTRLAHHSARLRADVLESIGLAAAVIARGNHRVLAVNRHFGSLNPSVSVGAFDRLVLRHRPAAQALAITLGNDDAIRSIPIPSTEDLPAVVVHVVPIRGAAHDVFLGSIAIVIFTPVTAPAVPATQLLNGLFDLTPAEARVSAALCSGQSVSRIAATLGVGRETIRSHLRAVFDKTGTRRQSDLLRLLSGISIPK